MLPAEPHRVEDRRVPVVSALAVVPLEPSELVSDASSLLLVAISLSHPSGGLHVTLLMVPPVMSE